MNSMFLIIRVLSGFCFGVFFALSVNFILFGNERGKQKNILRKSEGTLKKSWLLVSEEDVSKSFLSQSGSRLERLFKIYAQLTPQELHDEILKIDKENKHNPTGSLGDAIAVMFLAYCWGQKDATKAYNYGESVYLSNNPAMGKIGSVNWYKLVLQAWAYRDPLSAWKYVCQLKEEYRQAEMEVMKKAIPVDSMDFEEKESLEKSLFCNTGPSSNFRVEQVEQSLGFLDFEGVTEQIGYAMGNLSPDTALQWALEAEPIAVYGVLLSIAWNHPDKLPLLVANDKSGCINSGLKTMIADIWHEQHPEEAEKWIKGFTSGEQIELRKKWVYEEKMAKLESAFDLYNETVAGDKESLRKSIMYRFVEKEPEKILDWLQTVYYEEKLSHEDLYKLISPLTTINKSATVKVCRFLEGQKSNDFKATIGSCIFNFSSGNGIDFNGIASLAMMTNNVGQMDSETFDMAAERWKNKGGSLLEIKTWLESAPLSPEQKKDFECRYEDIYSKK